MSVSVGPNMGLMINALTGDSFDTSFRALLRAIDAGLFPVVIDHTLATPPASPANGDRYIVAASPTGAWAGKTNDFAVWTTDNPAAPSGEWEFYAPENGWTIYSRVAAGQLTWNGTAWIATPSWFVESGAAGTRPNQGLVRMINNAPATDGISWATEGGGSATIYVDSGNNLTIPAPLALLSANLVVTGAAYGVTAGQVCFGSTTATTATAGAQTLPANPDSFLIINVAGVVKKIPLYAN